MARVWHSPAARFATATVTIRSLLRSRAGNTSVLAAMMFTGVAGAAGLATDAGYWYAQKAQVQNVADAAAITAAAELSAGGSAADAIAEATDSAATNGMSAATGATVNVDVSSDGKTVSATIATVGPRFFSQLFLASGPTITASATATVLSAGTGSPGTCIYALNPSASGAVAVTGNGGIYTPQCGIQVNSTSSSAVTVTGNATIRDASTCIGGGARLTGNARILPAPTTSCRAVPDPLAGLTPPTVGGCDHYNTSVSANDTATFSPGVYCGGISLSGNARVTFEPGIYVIKDGSFTISGNASMSGQNVGFYLTGSGSFRISGNGDMHVSAPSSGTMQGILLWHDSASSGGGDQVTGNGELYYEGTLYFPEHDVSISGNGRQITSPWTMLIADTISATGNAFQANADFADSSVPPPEPFSRKKVVLTQ